MDPISAGASVLAFVVLALDGTKSLYQLIIGFKRATRETRAIAVAINDLQNVLRHFETSPVLNSPATELNDMVRVLSACHQDLTRFRQSIKEYQLASKVSKCRRVLQTVKSPFAKSELDFIRQSICDYHGALQIRLSIVNSSVLQTCKDEIHGLHNRAAANDLKTSTILDSVENITTSVRAHTEGIRKVQDTATAGVQQASSLIKDVQSMRSSVEYQMRNMSITSASAIDRHAAYSASRLEDILTAFRTLQEQFTSLPDQVASAQAKLTPLQGLAPPCSSSGQATNEDLELRHSLERLQRLSSSITRTLFDEEAKRIVDDLGRVLRALAKFGNEGLSSQSQQLTHVDSNDSITASEIDEVRSLVSLAGGVAINQGPNRVSAARFRRVLQKRRTKDFVSGNLTTTITINRRRLQRSDHHNGLEQLSQHTHDDEFYATIKTIVNDTHCAYVLMAYISQIKQPYGFFTFNPVVSIGMILPMDSSIFKTVTSGDLDGLRRILAHGEGTLRDRDCRGTPLLHYATSRRNRTIKHQMCKFLIENGADVEEVAPLALEDDDVYKCTPLESILQRCEQQEYAERFLSFRDLLAAGADPTNGALAVCLEGNEEFDYLKLILDNPIPFVELEARDIDGNTPLLRAADFAATRSDSWRILNSLLTSGANIYARSLNDANCIQVLVRNLFDFPGADRYLEVQTCLVLLIQAGADVHAFDEKGISIFDIAYRDCPGLCSAYLGDIWDSVLSICGYDIREARKGFHRVAAYRTFGNDCVAYTREKFELLWDGREKLCPYYNDPVIWCPFSVSPSGSCPYGGTRQVCPGPERELLSKEEPLRCRHCCPGGVADFEPDESEKGECEGAGFVEDELGKGAMYGGDSIAN